MAEFPCLPLWTDAYLADTTTLSTIEHGAYLLLLMAAWRSKGYLPDDDRFLARVTRLSGRQWQRIRVVMEPFWVVENGQWSNRRLLDEYAAVRRQRQLASDAGKASAMKRLHRGSTGVGTEGQRKANTPTPTPTPISVSPHKSPRKRMDDSPEFTAFWSACPKRIGKGDARKAYAKALRKADAPTLLAGMQAYATSTAGTDPRYICHPATWLNQERWSDDPPPEAMNGSAAPELDLDEIIGRV